MRVSAFENTKLLFQNWTRVILFCPGLLLQRLLVSKTLTAAMNTHSFLRKIKGPGTNVDWSVDWKDMYLLWLPLQLIESLFIFQLRRTTAAGKCLQWKRPGKLLFRESYSSFTSGLKKRLLLSNPSRRTPIRNLREYSALGIFILHTTKGILQSHDQVKTNQTSKDDNQGPRMIMIG